MGVPLCGVSRRQVWVVMKREKVMKSLFIFIDMQQQGGGKMQDDGMEFEFDMLLHLPNGIHVMMTADVISHMKDESSYLIVVENRHVILRPIVKE